MRVAPVEHVFFLFAVTPEWKTEIMGTRSYRIMATENDGAPRFLPPIYTPSPPTGRQQGVIDPARGSLWLYKLFFLTPRPPSPPPVLNVEAIPFRHMPVTWYSSTRCVRILRWGHVVNVESGNAITFSFSFFFESY